MRYLPFFLYIAVAFVLMLMSFSDYVFYKDASTRLLLRRLVLCLIWPFAAMSRRGRRVLFSAAKGVQ